MSDLVADFGTFLAEYELNKPAGLLQAVLDQMSPEKARQLKLCAIPHQFNAEILQTLAPELTYDVALSRCLEFAENPSVRGYGGEVFVVLEEFRDPLFQEWLKPEHREEFVKASERLVHYFSADNRKGFDAESLRVNRVFHLVGADPQAGFVEFEELFGERRQRSAPGESEVLIRLANEYHKLLSPSQRANLTYQEAKLSMDLLRVDEARRLFESVLRVDNLDPVLRMKTVIRLGLLEHDMRNWTMAIEHFNDALKLLETIPDEEIKQTFHYRIKLNLGVTYRDMGELQEAKRLLLESVHQAHRAGSKTGRAVAYNSLGTLFRKIGEGKTAIKAYTKCLELLDPQKEIYRKGQLYNNLGLAYIDEREWKKGEKALLESLKIKQAAGDTIGIGKTYNNLMQVYRVQEMEYDAVQTAIKAINCFMEVGDHYDMALATRNLGRLYRALGKKEQTLKCLGDAVGLFERAQAFGEAQSLREEIQVLTIGKKRNMPWWTWVLYTVAGLVFLLLLAMLILGVVFVFFDI